MNTSATGRRILGIIPARGGSKGLPGKNIRPLVGLPLIVHSIAAAAATPIITRTIITTDSEEIASVARAHGGDVPFMRPSALAADETPMSPVLRHALAWVEETEGRKYDAVILLDPTSPIRCPAQLESAAELLFDRDDADGVISVSAPTFNPLWVGVQEDDSSGGLLRRLVGGQAGAARRQDVARFLRINGNFYLWRSPFIRRLETSWFDEGSHLGFEIPEVQSYSIDDQDEFDVISALLATGVVRLPWLDRTTSLGGIS